MKSKLFCISVIACFAIIIGFTGCSKSDSKGNHRDETELIKKFEKAMMEQYYYWASQMRAPQDASSYTPYTYFNALKVSQDRWSWMCDGDTYQASQTGVATSFGFHLKQPINYYKDYGVYISYVDKNSPLAKAGVTRGWRLDKIDGSPVMNYVNNNTFEQELAKSNNNFTFINLDGDEVSLSLTQATFKSNSVIATQIFDHSNYPPLPSSKKVGYINYITFNENLSSEILDALSQMKSAGINELILDLRYNGGGDLNLCSDIASLLVPGSAHGKTFLHIAHNNMQSSNDFYKKFNHTSNSLDLNRLYVITTKNTASASESIINGLSPFLEVITIGETSYGKPNGMYVILYPNNAKTYSEIDYAFYPICFYCLNSDEKADFANGINPTYERADDLYHNFGPEEDLINSALYHIATNSLPPAPIIPTSTKQYSPSYKNIIIKGAEECEGYGKATFKMGLKEFF